MISLSTPWHKVRVQVADVRTIRGQNIRGLGSVQRLGWNVSLDLTPSTQQEPHQKDEERSIDDREEDEHPAA